MRIFDPKNQFGSSLLSSADTQKSSVKLEKQMTVGGGAITLTSTDISDIENWELSNARVEVDGQMISFLPDTSRGTNGDLTVDFGTYFPNAVLILKRTVFDGMKQEEEEITIEVEIRQLMAKTMAAATSPTPRTEEQIQENIDEWKALGVRAFASDPVKYANAARENLGGYEITGEGEVVVEDCFLSADTFVEDGTWKGIIVSGSVSAIRWHSDLPSLREDASGAGLPSEKIIEWTGRMPNLQNANGMFSECSGLTSWTVEFPNSLTDAPNMFSRCYGLTSFSTPSGSLPNSLTTASDMFYCCTGLTSWTVELPNSLTNANCMFGGCSGLTSFSTPSGMLPSSLTTAYKMFEGCSGLKSFTPSLGGLTNCVDFEGMFQGCILNEASIRNILGTLPDRKNKDELTIHIDGDNTIDAQTQTDLGNLADSVAQDKNWTIVLRWNTPPTPTV